MCMVYSFRMAVWGNPVSYVTRSASDWSWGMYIKDILGWSELTHFMLWLFDVTLSDSNKVRSKLSFRFRELLGSSPDGYDWSYDNASHPKWLRIVYLSGRCIGISTIKCSGPCDWSSNTLVCVKFIKLIGSRCSASLARLRVRLISCI